MPQSIINKNESVQINKQESNHEQEMINFYHLPTQSEESNKQNIMAWFQINKQYIFNLVVFIVASFIIYTIMRTYELQVSQKNLQTQQVQISCAKNHKIAYIWLGNNTIPLPYQKILDKCKDNVILLGDKQLRYYNDKWNEQFGKKIYFDFNSPYYNINDKSDLLKLLYLFYQGGVYADFDEIINESCWQSYTGDQIIFTNYWLIDHERYIPQQSFMKVNQKRNVQVGKMIIMEVTKKFDRWAECHQRQCLILKCQTHLWNRLWTKVEGTTK